MARVYVGNLPMNMRESDLEDIFYKYGRVKEIDLKTPLRPPAYAFISFENFREAEDAVRGRDKYDFEGNRIRVEIARSLRDRDRDRRGPPPPRSFGYRGAYGRTPAFAPKQSDFQVIVTGLPNSASWQDLKDHMRKAGDVVYADVDHRGGGIVHYANRGDMDYALRKLDDSEFRNPFDRGFIRVSLPRSHSRRDSRSPPRRRGGRYSSSRSRSRSRSRSHRRHRKSLSRSRSYSSRSRSYSRSRSRSPSISRSKSPMSEDKAETKSDAKIDEVSPNRNNEETKEPLENGHGTPHEE